MKFFKVKPKYEESAEFHCKDCAPSFSFKNFKWNSLPAFLIFTAAVVTLVTVVVLLFTGVSTPKEKAEKQYAKLFAMYEKTENKTPMKSGSILLKETFIREMQNLDSYVMHIYAEDTDSTIQKITKDGKTTYYFDLNGVEFGEYSNKSYIWDDEAAYEFGEDVNVKYHYGTYEYAQLCAYLGNFLPEKFCLKDKPQSEVWLKDEDENEVNLFYYTEHISALNYNGGFYEKYGDRLVFVEDGETEPILSLPKDVKWTEFKN